MRATCGSIQVLVVSIYDSNIALMVQGVTNTNVLDVGVMFLLFEVRKEL